MCCSAPESAFLCPVCPAWISTVLEIKAYLVEALFGDKVLPLWSQISSVDDGINESVAVRAEVATSFNAADTFEAEGIPDAA